MVTEVRGKWKLSVCGGREGDGGWVEDKKKQVKSLHSSRKAQDLTAGTSEEQEWRAEDRIGWDSLRGGSSGQGCTPLHLAAASSEDLSQKTGCLPLGGWTKRGERLSPFGFSLWSYPPLALSLASALFFCGSLSQGLSGSFSFFSARTWELATVACRPPCSELPRCPELPYPGLDPPPCHRPFPDAETPGTTGWKNLQVFWIL